MTSLLTRIQGIIRAPQLASTPEQLTGFPARTDNLPRWQQSQASDAIYSAQLSKGEIKYWVYPTDTDPSNRPWLLMIHGFRGDHHGLSNLVDGLGDFNLLVPDLPGFGLSPVMNQTHSVGNYAAMLRELVNQVLPQEPFYLLGHSFGSIVATKLATDLPNLAALVLVNPIAELPLSASNKVMSVLTAQYYRASSLLPRRLGYALLRSPLVVRFMTEFMVVSSDEQIRALAHEQHDRYFSGFASRQVLEEAYRASISHHCGMDAADVPVPVLLIAGALDPLGSVEAQQELAALFPRQTQLVVLPEVGHLIHYEKAPEAVEAIRRFLPVELN
ncbi:alpha/beta fold hydrolase [Micrococcoides hystricis]|uniref:Alpha/beta fold hydrolase n=1 Tax=Micrococcoides hystricis TaxID=1572761 RepID=A0ABV6P7F5_9MICC